MKKKETLTEIDERQDKKREKEILELLSLITAISSLGGRADGIRKKFRSYVEKHPLGITEKGYKFWEKDKAGVELRDNFVNKVNPRLLIKKIELKKALNYLLVDYDSLREDVEEEKIPLSPEGLAKITNIRQRKKKVIPYYGPKYTKKAILLRKKG